jgi:ABC-2 type transport system ATP-binding protein
MSLSALKKEIVMIELKNVSMHFGSTLAIDDVSFEITGAGTVGLLGPNGAGKSTAMRLITSYLQATYGTVRVGGLDPNESPLAVREMIGYLPEQAPLYPEMQVDEYLRFVGAVRGVADLNKRIDWVIGACGLEAVVRRPIIELSKGYRQRTGLAQAILHDPKVLVLDEPTSGLDPIQVIAMRSLIGELAKEKTILLSSHILSEVSETSERCIIINDGRSIADGTLDELRKRVRPQVSFDLQVEADGSDARAAIAGLPEVGEVTLIGQRDSLAELRVTQGNEVAIWGPLSALVAQRGWPIRRFAEEELTLEQVFLELTQTRSSTVEGS